MHGVAIISAIMITIRVIMCVHDDEDGFDEEFDGYDVVGDDDGHRHD